MSGQLKARLDDGNTPVLNDWGVDSEYGKLHDVLIGPAGNYQWRETSSLSRATLRKGYRLDKATFLKQYNEIVSAYESAGVKVHTLPEQEGLPYQLFARDSSFMTPWGAVITAMAHWWRRGENYQCIRFYSDNNIPIYDMVTSGCFEGGDFNIIEPGAVLIGCGGERSQEHTAREIAGWMEKEGWEVKITQFDEFFVHIDLMVVMLADKLAAVCLETTEPDVVDWLKAKGIEIVPVSFNETMELGCNAMALGDDKAIVPKHAKGLVEKLRAHGFTVYDPDIDMIWRGGGGLHCMAQPLKRDPVGVH